MSIHNNPAVNIEGVAENDVRRLSSDTSQLDQFFHGPWNFSAVPLDQSLAASLDTFGFVAKETRGFDLLLEDCEVGVRVVFCGGIFFKEIGRNHVYSLIGALGGKDCRNEQFERVRKVQFAMRVGISFLQSGNNFFGSGGFGFECLAWHAVIESGLFVKSDLIQGSTTSD